MSTYVLVHGAWHGAWCWKEVLPRLEERGHSVVTLDLPGHGEDRTPISEVTLDAYVRRVCDVVSGQHEPVILVGHSMGGLVITRVAEEIPERLSALVYVTAFLLPSGTTLQDAAQKDEAALVLPNLVANDQEGSGTLPEELLPEIFYADCPPEAVSYAIERLVPQALGPFVTPLHHSEERFGSVPRIYVECTQDRAITLEAQRSMHGALPCRRVVTMETSHSPFFAKPGELAQHLHAAAAS